MTDDQAVQIDQDVPEQMRIRRDKRDRLLAEGREPYAATLLREHRVKDIRGAYPDLVPDQITDDVVTVGGRVMFVRGTGKLIFVTIQDGFTPDADSERLQVMLSLAEIGEEELAHFKTDVDLGDIIWFKGRVGMSRRGELSVFANEWKLASKALRPMPVLHKDLAEESRVRDRHSDLVVRKEARDIVRMRATVTHSVRTTLHDMGYLEIETPILQLVHGGAAARPFRTHMNAFDQDMTMRIALELFLKRAMAGGADRVYEIGRIFRNEGVDSSHAPEFTMLEAYQSWGDQKTIADMTKTLIVNAADALGRRQYETPMGEVNLDGDWAWVSVYEGLSEKIGETIDVDTPREQLVALLERFEIEYDPKLSDGKLAMELFEALIEPTLLQPTFVYDYPAVAQPLARNHRSKPGLVEAWDLIIAGVERGTGFTELVDPIIQREVLTAQSLRAAGGDPEAMQLDEDFLRALETGVPPMGGMGMGMDRLMMLFAGAGIRETILFPLLKPQG